MRVSPIADATEAVQVAAPAPVSPADSTPAAAWKGLVYKVFSFPVVLIAGVMLIVFLLAKHGLSDPDIWLHLRNSEYLFTYHSFPRVDHYSFTAAGHPWIAHEWLAEVAFYLAWRCAGLVGIKALSLLLLEAIFGLLTYYCYQCSRNIKAAALACSVGIALGTVSFGPRTLLFGFIYLLVLLIILERYRTLGRAPLWVLPGLFCLWINTHGSWSLGLVVFGIYLASGFVSGQWGSVEASRWSPRQLRSLLVAWGASAAAIFINPFGYHLVLYPVDLAFHQRLAVAHTAEWVSVDFHNLRGKIVFLLVVGLLLAALTSRHRWKLHELGLVLFGLYTGLTYIRFLFLLGILVAPVIASLLKFVPPYRREIDKPLLNAVLLAGVLAIVVTSFPSTAELEQSIRKDFPAEVLPYLRTHPLSGRVLNDYTWGGYLIWHDRDLKDFADSRADIFDYTGVLKDYLDFLDVNEPDKLLDKYRIRYVLFQRSEPLAYVLRHDQRWRTLFEGKISILLERTGPEPAAP